jgi:hypothetical protein
LLCLEFLLNRSGETTQPCKISDFNRNNHSCSPFSMVFLLVCHIQTLLCWGTFFLFLVYSHTCNPSYPRRQKSGGSWFKANPVT